MTCRIFNPFPDGISLTLSKFKAFADVKIHVTLTIISVFDRVENIVGKGENAGYQYFLFFPQCFQKASFQNSSKGVMCGNGLKRVKSFVLCQRAKADVAQKPFANALSPLFTQHCLSVCLTHYQITKFQTGPN